MMVLKPMRTLRNEGIVVLDIHYLQRVADWVAGGGVIFPDPEGHFSVDYVNRKIGQYLQHGFTWQRTPQGYAFWQGARNSGAASTFFVWKDEFIRTFMEEDFMPSIWIDKDKEFENDCE